MRQRKMVLRILNDFLAVEGDPVGLAEFTHALLSIFKIEDELKKRMDAKKEADNFADFMNKTFGELMQNEMQDEQKEDEESDD